MGIRIERVPRAPEFSEVYRDGEYLGWFGRTEELGIVEWQAYTADHRRVGSYRGRGARQVAIAALIKGETEVDRMI